MTGHSWRQSAEGGGGVEEHLGVEAEVDEGIDTDGGLGEHGGEGHHVVGEGAPRPVPCTVTWCQHSRN